MCDTNWNLICLLFRAKETYYYAQQRLPSCYEARFSRLEDLWKFTCNKYMRRVLLLILGHGLQQGGRNLISEREILRIRRIPEFPQKHMLQQTRCAGTDARSAYKSI